MHHNDLKCGAIVNFVASQSHFFYDSEVGVFFFGGGGWERSGLILGLLFRRSKSGLR